MEGQMSPFFTNIFGSSTIERIIDCGQKVNPLEPFLVFSRFRWEKSCIYYDFYIIWFYFYDKHELCYFGEMLKSWVYKLMIWNAILNKNAINLP